jgi:hypothetical protein
MRTLTDRAVWQRALISGTIVLVAYVLILLLSYLTGSPNVPRHRIESPLFILAFIVAVHVWLLEPERAAAGLVGVGAWALPAAVISSFVLYGPALSVGWLSDDYVLAHWAATHAFVAEEYEFVRPLPIVVWSVILATGGKAGVVHATSLLLHGLNGFMVGEVAILCGLGSAAALTAAAMFIIWPTQVEPVIWASGQFDVMATTLCLAAVLAVARPRSLAVQVGSVVLLSVAALLSKESALALPLLLGIVLVARRDGRLSSSQIAAVAVVGALTVCYGVWRVLIHSRIRADPFLVVSRYAAKELVARTIGALSVPLTADAIARAPWAAFLLASLPLAAGATLLATTARRSSEHVTAVSGLLWTIVAAAPAIAYLFVDSRMAGSRYLYMPAAGWSLSLAALAQLAWRRSAAARWVTGFACTAICAIAIWQGRTLQGEWAAAAIDRDALLSQATVAAESCGEAVFRDLPAMHGGAQLFRNGFAEAFAEQRPGDASGKRRCSFRWTGTSFVSDER